MNGLLNILGISIILVLLYILSWNRKKLNFKMIGKALVIQFIIAFILIKVPLGTAVLLKVSNFISAIIDCGKAGNEFVFGPLADLSSTGFVFAIQVLGNIIFLSSLVGMLYYIGILGFMVKWIGKAIGKVLGTSQVESFVSVANMFLGQTESPILIGKYIRKMTDSEIMVVLVSGMGSMSVSILGGYAALGIPMECLLLASAMVPVGGILVSKILLPETGETQVVSNVKMDNKGANSNIIDALSEGAMTGVQIALAIGGTLIAMVSLVTAINQGLAFLNISLEQIFSYVFAPFGFFMGVDQQEVLVIGELLGTKLVLNEFAAFAKLGEIISEMSPRTAVMTTISLCGFANFSSLGICVAGISLLCPDKRSTLSKLVFKAMIGGIAVSLLSAMIIGFVMSF
ncbi:MAG: nucleoside transporter C-terminal domain-containing protein [Eubacteriales bacterium]